MFCSNCGLALAENSLDCQNCGTHIVIPKQESPHTSGDTTKDTLNMKEPDVILHDLVDSDEKEIFERNQLLQTQIKRFKPISTWTFFWMEVIALIPFVNLIVFFIWAFKKDVNVNRKSFAREKLLRWLIFGVIPIGVLALFIIMHSTFGVFVENFINHVVNFFQ